MIQKLKLSQLSEKEPIGLLRVLSFDPDLYLVEVEINGICYSVVDEDDRPLSYRSQLAAKRPFRNRVVKKAVLRHQSTFDEMIGQQQREGSNQLEVSIQLPHLDYS